ncbi:MAG: hypothetical protein LBC03_05440 [Nitrososphaerota archaeon]|jgi:hypothetical protein|nr:hypothetical protein [Nitrososphaerota archaeon]
MGNCITNVESENIASEAKEVVTAHDKFYEYNDLIKKIKPEELNKRKMKDEQLGDAINFGGQGHNAF